MPKNPFSLSPDPAYLYLTDALHTVCEKIRFTLDERQGISIVYGEVGTGKTCLMRLMVGEYEAREDCRTVPMYGPQASTELQLLKALCVEFGLPVRHGRLAQESVLRKFAINEYQEGRNVVVFVDETQRLPGATLELFRSLNNFETNDTKLINVILFGQLELRDRLKDRSKKALLSRIFLYSVLEPLTLEDTDRLIKFRLEKARSPITFDADAVDFVFRWSKGIPRKTVKLCDVAWLFARTQDVTRIDLGMVEASVRHVPDDTDE